MVGSNLRFYRLKKGLTKRALAEACGLTPMAISHYEAGNRKPDIGILERLASALGVGLADLLRRRNESLAFEHGAFSRDERMTAAVRNAVYAFVEEYCGRFFDVLEVLGGEPLPKAPKSSVLRVTDDVEADAAALRAHLGVAPGGPVYDLVGLLENQGVLVIVLDGVDDSFDGVNGFVNGRPYVAVNGSLPVERVRLTIAHELVHLMFDWPADMPSAGEERLANEVGGAFLLPAEDTTRELGFRRSTVTQDMLLVAVEYGVSMAVLARRARAAGIVGEAAYARFCSTLKKGAQPESEGALAGREQPTLFCQLVYRAVCEDAISIQRGAELLDRSYDDVAAACAPYGM
jgi:Zn-dependent peptidase ImmA (M78 family)/transcriptional regulator with XRE-family HTH domain